MKYPCTHKPAIKNSTQVCQCCVSTTPTMLSPQCVLTGSKSEDYKGSSRGPAAPPSTKLMSSTLFIIISPAGVQKLPTLLCFTFLSDPEHQQSKQINTGASHHEMPEQPGRQPPDRAGGVWVGRHGQWGLGEPGLLWLPSTPASSCQHHLQPAAPLPGLHGQHVQTRHPQPVTRGTRVCWPKSGEETQRLLLFYQR